MKETETYWLYFCGFADTWINQKKALLSYFETPKAFFEAPDVEFDPWRRSGLPWIPEILEERASFSPEKLEQKMQEYDIHFCSRESDLYPVHLREIPDAPYGLFYRGDLPEPQRPGAAIVGARACTPYGAEMAERLAEEFTERGVQIISGMAVGIDGHAQKAALEKEGRSFGVLGGGVDLCYPRENLELFHRLCQGEGKGVISEYKPGSPHIPSHFPQRNRIISGLCSYVCVIEARKISGSLITARLALDQGREVYALPGRASDELSTGCNMLIDDGAGIITSPEELMMKLFPEEMTQGGREDKGKALRGLTSEERLVYGKFHADIFSDADLVRMTGIPPQRINGVLLQLQMKGLVAESGRGRYRKIRTK